MKPFEQIEHPSDIGITASGSSLSELFSNAAAGMFSLIADLKAVEPKEKHEVEAAGDDIPSLLVNWLNELLFLEDTKHVVFSGFKIVSLSDKEARGAAFGEKIDVSRHGMSRSIKAATYNRLKVWQEDGAWKARVVFDV